MKLIKSLQEIDDENLGIRLFSNVRNEEVRLPFFLDYYRSKGVSKFFIVDNNSTDGTVKFLKEQNDVTLYQTDQSFLESSCGLTWLDYMRDTHGRDEWCLTVDCDELLVYPMSDWVSLPQLCQYLDQEGYDGLFSLMLDLYPKEALDNIAYEVGDHFLTACSYFDSAGYFTNSISHFPYFGVYGGPRFRSFYKEKSGSQGPTMRKIPLVKWSKGVEYLSVTHSTTEIRLADITGALLHFKYIGSFKKHVDHEVERRDRNMKDYQVYKEALDDEKEFSFYDKDISIKFIDDAQLIQLSLIKNSINYHHWAFSFLSSKNTNFVSDLKVVKQKYRNISKLDGRSDNCDFMAFNSMWDTYNSFNSDDAMLISVVVPVFNAEKYIERAIKSALKQKEVGEIIIVEDCSTDNSFSICQRLAERSDRIKLIQHESKINQGAGSSKNLGILNSKFQLIAFLDADDYYLPDRFSSTLKKMRNDDSIDGVYGVQQLLFEKDDLYELRKQSGLPTITAFTGNKHHSKLFNEINPVGKKGNFHANTLTVRKRVFETVGLFSKTRCEDVDMWLKMAYSLKLASNTTDKAVSVKCVHSDNRMSRDNTRKHRSSVFLSVLKHASDCEFDRTKLSALINRYFDSLANIDYEAMSALDKSTALEGHLKQVISILGTKAYYLRGELKAVNKKRIGISDVRFERIVMMYRVRSVLKGRLQRWLKIIEPNNKIKDSE